VSGEISISTAAFRAAIPCWRAPAQEKDELGCSTYRPNKENPGNASILNRRRPIKVRLLVTAWWGQPLKRASLGPTEAI